MKFYMYGRTPRVKTPKWITVFLISFFVCLAAFFFMLGIVMSIDAKSILPFLIIFFCIVLFVFLISPICYNMNHAYIEIAGETIKIIEYPFFKKRQRSVLLCNIKKVKWRAGGHAQLPYSQHIILKNFSCILVPFRYNVFTTRKENENAKSKTILSSKINSVAMQAVFSRKSPEKRGRAIRLRYYSKGVRDQ